MSAVLEKIAPGAYGVAPLPLEEVVTCSTDWVFVRPITFDEFAAQWGRKTEVELIDGVIRQRMEGVLSHELKFAFLLSLLNTYAQQNDLGVMLGSRTKVKINEYRGRIPDLLFVRAERLSILEEDAIRAAPDLVIEIVSKNDSASNLIALETDYRSIRVPEIIFIDAIRNTVRVVRLQGSGDYAEETLSAGSRLVLETINHIALPTDWLFADTPPQIADVLAQITRP